VTQIERDDLTITVFGLTDAFRPPESARPRTRAYRPPGYGVREQCLPFASAAALGITVPSPFSWGCCLPSDAPPGGRAFRSPVGPLATGDDRAFYVLDDPDVGFERNQFRLKSAVVERLGDMPTPGLSFFDRADQQSMIKIHLPYGWRSPAGVELLFSPPVNRPRGDGFTVLSGLVETAWYHNAVNLVGVIPPPPSRVHMEAGEPLAQVIPVTSDARSVCLDVLDSHRTDARDSLDSIVDWHRRHDSDRSAYKRLSRSDQGGMSEP
jgi:hypothetical protein